MKIQFREFFSVRVLVFFAALSISYLSAEQIFNHHIETYGINSKATVKEFDFLNSVRACIAQEGIIKSGALLQEAAKKIVQVPEESELYYNPSVVLMREFLDENSCFDRDLKALARAVLQNARPTSVGYIAQVYRAVTLDKEPIFATFIPTAVFKGRGKEDLKIIIPDFIKYQQEWIDALHASTICLSDAGVMIPGDYLYNWSKGMKKLAADEVAAVLNTDNLKTLITQATQVSQYIQSVLPSKIVDSFEHDKACIKKMVAQYEAEGDKEQGELAIEAMSVFFSSAECTTLMFSHGCWQELLKAAESFYPIVQAFVDRGDLDQDSAKAIQQELTEVVAPYFPFITNCFSTLQRVLPGLIESKIISQAAADELQVRLNDYCFSK